VEAIFGCAQQRPGFQKSNSCEETDARNPPLAARCNENLTAQITNSLVVYRVVVVRNHRHRQNHVENESIMQAAPGGGEKSAKQTNLARHDVHNAILPHECIDNVIDRRPRDGDRYEQQ
jgi:hypothetical protein